MSEPTPEKMIEILKNEVWLRDTEIGRLDKEVESLRDEIERLNIHYDGTIMYGNRLVDLIEWAERNGIDFPAKIYNPCVIAIDHFRNERERLKEIE